MVHGSAVIPVSDVERIVGMERFYTGELPGIGGKLKETPSDFIVDEISLEPKPCDAGRFAIARIRAVNWESNKLIREIARHLRVNRSQITFAGTKDKRAITTQLVSIPTQVERVTALRIHDMDVISAYSSNHSLKIGRLLGNRFDLMVKRLDLEPTELHDRIAAIKAQLDELKGFPNYFGLQRFGAIRPVTHLMGKRIVMKDFEGAIVEYLGHPSDLEDDATREARRNIQQDRDFDRAFDLFPKTYVFERTMLYHLTQRPGDFIGALQQLPRNLLMMFTHAYQSYIFNRILSRRIREGLPINTPVEGDLVLPETRFGLPSHSSHIEVTKRNIAMVTKACAKQKAFVSAMIYGSDSVFPNGEIGEIERAIVEEEKVRPEDFVVPDIMECTSSGTRKEICAPYKDMSFAVGHGWARFLFSLNKGCYATTLLREFMKCPESTSY